MVVLIIKYLSDATGSSFPPLSLPEAETAVSTLDGRWFGGRMIKAELYDEEKFEANDLSR